MDKKTLKKIEKLIEYLYDSEYDDYYSLKKSERKNHIFITISELAHIVACTKAKIICQK